MRIKDYKETIKMLPYEEHSFDINKSSWKKVESQKELIQSFLEEDKLTINRFELLMLGRSSNISEFIIKVLMWGYPTLRRGNHIKNILEPNNFKLLEKTLYNYRNSDCVMEQLRLLESNVKGLGISTLSKFLYFLNAKVEGIKPVIIDDKVMKVINANKFNELSPLVGINRNKVMNHLYVEYLRIIDSLAIEMNVKHDQIEMFLFIFGNNVSELKGDGGWLMDEDEEQWIDFVNCHGEIRNGKSIAKTLKKYNIKPYLFLQLQNKLPIARHIKKAAFDGIANLE